MEDLTELNPFENTHFPRRRTLSFHRDPPRNSNGRKYSTISYSPLLERVSFNDHADHIVSKLLEDDKSIMDDNKQAELNRIKAVRNLPQSFAMKRLVRHKLTPCISNRPTKEISRFKQIKYSCSILFKKAQTKVEDFLFRFELWYSTIKRIEGEFGSTTAIFYKFFRYIFVLNTLCLLPCLFFVIIPQLLHNVESNHIVNNGTLSFWNIFTGDGYFTETVLYFGFYTNSTISLTDFSYSMPHGYFYTMLLIYILIFIVLAARMTQSYRKTFIKTRGTSNTVYSQKVFASWDFNIATFNASKLKSLAIFHEIQELLENESQTEETSCFKKFATLMLRLAGNLLIVSTIALISYAIWTLLETHRSGERLAYIEVITAVVINASMYIIPLIFTLISKYEDYRNPRMTLYLNLCRLFLLQIGIFGVLISYWIFNATNQTSDCWETSFGQEIYRLIVFDFVFYIVTLFLWQFCRFFLHRHGICKFRAPEFEVSRHTLQLMFNQSLFWLGLYFSPLLCLLMFVKYLLTWYLSTWSLLLLCKPTARSWRASHTHTWFLMVFFGSLLIVLGVLGYIIASIPVSNCGPFTDYRYVYDIIKEGINNLEKGDMFWRILIFATKPGVVAIILIVLCCFIYMLREKSKVQEANVEEIRKMLLSATKDKEYLLEKLHEINREENVWKGEYVDPRYAVPGRYIIKKDLESDPVETDEYLDDA